RRFKRFFALRVRDVSLPFECGKLFPSPFLHSVYKCLIAEGAKERKGALFAIFFTHEEQWNMRRQQHQAGCQSPLRRRQQAGKPIPRGPVPHLVMVLDTDNEALARVMMRARA